MLHQLNIHCDTYDLLPDYQLAYHENYSCEMTSSGHLNINLLCLSKCWIYLLHLTVSTILS